MINKTVLKTIPSTVGVYLFKKKKEVLYIGKSVNVKSRIANHLQSAKNNPKENLLIQEADRISVYSLDSEFKAILLESELIKKYQPKYNVRWLDDKDFLYIKINLKDEFPKPVLVRKENDNESIYFGPFSSKRESLMILREFRKVVPFCTEKKISMKPCFYSKIGLCNPCPNFINSLTGINEKKRHQRLYRKNINNLIQLLKGNFVQITKKYFKEINQFSKKNEFEKALVLREKIKTLNFLLNEKKINIDLNSEIEKENLLEKLTAFLRKYLPVKALSRIEGYDVSDFSFQEAAASMVVFIDGYPDKSQYRRFRLKTSESDIQMIRETIERRLKNKWPIPDLMVVDGGVPQLRVAQTIIQQMRLQIAAVGLAKNPDRLIIMNNDIIKKILLKNIPGGEILINLRNEAHRFARKYHLFLRTKKFFLN